MIKKSTLEQSETTMPHTPKTPLDHLDLRLLRELEINARQTIVDLSEKLSISKPTLKGRIQRLLDQHIIKILTVVDPLALGYKTQVNLGLNTLPGKVDSVANALASFRQVVHVSIHSGRYNAMGNDVILSRSGRSLLPMR